MASMRRLNRRLLRWRRYEARIAKLVPVLADRGLRRGHYRAARDVDREEQRRFWAETPEIWLGGPEGERALIADVLDWPPPTDEEQRRIDHRDACWDGCDDLHGNPCEYCESTCCDGDCWGMEYEAPTFPTVVTEYAFADRGLL